jgi:6-phosphogluconolactonase/glucosamine-6-phosphate isomerase/deaminase
MITVPVKAFLENETINKWCGENIDHKLNACGSRGPLRQRKTLAVAGGAAAKSLYFYTLNLSFFCVR